MSGVKYLKELSPGTLLFAEGEPSEAAYFVEQGTLEVFKLVEGGEVILGQLEPGDIVGEMALIDSGPRSASVRVLEQATVMELTEESMLTRLEESDPLVQLVLCVVLDRLRSSLSRVNREELGGGGSVNPSNVPPALRDQVIDRARLEHDLRAGFDAGELCLYYQPILDLETFAPVALEALLRWERPGHGVVTPGVFVALAEETDLIVSIGRWIVDEACKYMAKPGPASELYVSVNVATRQFENDSIADTVRDGLNRWSVDPARMQLEITESAMMAAPDRAAEALTQCRKLGCRVAVDDFGTGYSSLAYLQHFDVDAIKIDRSFVLGMRAERGGAKLIRGIAALGKTLDLDVVVEGIETRAEAERLRDLGCDYGQGFFFARPLEATEMDQWLNDWKDGRIIAA